MLWDAGESSLRLPRTYCSILEQQSMAGQRGSLGDLGRNKNGKRVRGEKGTFSWLVCVCVCENAWLSCTDATNARFAFTTTI